MVPEPLFALKITVFEFADQIAYKVKFAVCPCAYGNEITEPDEVVDQPTKVFPAFVGAVGADEMLAPVFTVPLETAEPP